tara:strand:- start:2076 stop:2264 length:189 start_codon:yes stop_codon:yes gene_type:complete
MIGIRMTCFYPSYFCRKEGATIDPLNPGLSSREQIPPTPLKKFGGMLKGFSLETVGIRRFSP